MKCFMQIAKINFSFHLMPVFFWRKIVNTVQIISTNINKIFFTFSSSKQGIPIKFGMDQIYNGL